MGTSEVLDKISTLSKFHPQRKTLISYIRSLICDTKNRGVRCCGVETAPTTQPRTTTQRTRPIPANEKDRGTWKPQASKKECGTSLHTVFVIGGEITKFGDFPFMALLGYNKTITSRTRSGSRTNPLRNHPYDYNCGAAVINKYYVLTAAHCMNTRTPVYVKKNLCYVKSLPNYNGLQFIFRVVILGEHDLRKDPEFSSVAKRAIIEIEDIIVHENYSKILNGGASPNDIALIRVKDPITFYNARNRKESNVKPICLPWNVNDPGRRIYDGNRLTTLGWGKVTNNKDAAKNTKRRLGAGSAILRKLEVPAISRRKCKEFDSFKNYDLNSSSQLCAGGVHGKDSCNGDSGGPLIQKAKGLGKPWFQVGVVSFGTSRCGAGQPGIYTRLVTFIPWIEQNLKP